MTKFTYVELFAGIGGFRQALDRIGGECVFASEIDKFATQAYQTLYNGAPELHGDITKIDEKDIPEHDVLVGGFPCQAFSVAGKRLGFADETRGTLFFEIVRIMREKKPKIALLENVKGLVGHDKGNTLNTVVTALNEIGYTVDFDVLNSKYFGVPQNRERIFIIAVRDDIAQPGEWVIEGNNVVAKGRRRIAEFDGVKTFNFDWPEQGEVTTRLRDILETNVDEKYYLSEDKTAKLVAQLEAKEPNERMSRQAVETYNESTLPKEHGDIIHAFRREHLKDGICPTLSTRPEGFKTAPLPVVSVDPQMLGHIELKGHDAIKRVYSTESVGPTLTTMGGGHREPKIAEEQEWWGDIETEQDEWETEMRIRAEEVRPVLTPDRIEKRQNGRRFKEDGEESFTLTAQDRHGVALGYREQLEEDVRNIVAKSRPNEEISVKFKENGDIRPHRNDSRKSGISELNINHEDNPSFTITSAHAPKIYGERTKYRIRKLTPLECFRLQGFSDEDHAKLVDAGISNSQRYKMAGNAVTVNVIDAIGAKLLRYLT